MTGVSGARRRGTVLNEAILEAAWQELSERSFAGLTLDAVAARAGTSRPVLARRWRSREELLVAALNHHLGRRPIVVPDLGELRAELASFLMQITDRGAPLVDVVQLGLGAYFEATYSTLDDLRQQLRQAPPLDDIYARAVDRGEIESARLTPRIAALPVDLVRHETFQTRQSVAESAILEIIDTIFLPLVAPSRGRPGDGG